LKDKALSGVLDMVLEADARKGGNCICWLERKNKSKF
jgi:hypothetical protein